VDDGNTDAYSSCRLCGHTCDVNRHAAFGVCATGAAARVAATVVHRGEEPAISLDGGTGNVFFAGCSLRCVFCQNHEISQGSRGTEVTPEALASAILALEAREVATIGLVTPTHVTPSVAAALRLARGGGLRIPVVHNGAAVDTPAALDLLKGLVEVYMPDLKWARAGEAHRYSGAAWYPEVSRTAVRSMAAQVGPLDLDGHGLARRGLLVRHLVLPRDEAGSLHLLAWLADEVPGCAVSLLRQYAPLHRALRDPRIGRPVTDDEYSEVAAVARWMGFDPIYVQDRSSTTVGVPDWDDPAIFRF
jgi:putative pyruvate formate lyase activating enzyme